MYTLPEWLQLDDQIMANIVAPRAATAAIYLNGTRRWFLSQNKNWADYSKTAGLAQRELSQLFYDHGLQTLIQPLLGYDLLERGQQYLRLAVEQGLAEMATADYRDWYHSLGIRVTFYGNWSATLSKLGFTQVVKLLDELAAETRHYTQRKLLLGLFADESLDNVVALAKHVNQGEELLNQYYGQPVGPVDLIIGSGQPAIWDLPLLDINKASMYFLQAPTFSLDRETLRQILYDHLYQRINDDAIYDDLTTEVWGRAEVLGIGQRTQKGWIAA
ncbi:MAG TPA: hypothetical protein VEC93_15505 [Anaerolineae bacterium]|nr:hypothetical protein [Anaerolineae bacterium]